MISARPILIKVTFLKHFALEVWVSIDVVGRGDESVLIKSTKPATEEQRTLHSCLCPLLLQDFKTLY